MLKFDYEMNVTFEDVKTRYISLIERFAKVSLWSRPLESLRFVASLLSYSHSFSHSLIFSLSLALARCLILSFTLIAIVECRDNKSKKNTKKVKSTVFLLVAMLFHLLQAIIFDFVHALRNSSTSSSSSSSSSPLSLSSPPNHNNDPSILIHTLIPFEMKQLLQLNFQQLKQDLILRTTTQSLSPHEINNINQYLTLIEEMLNRITSSNPTRTQDAILNNNRQDLKTNVLEQ
jgi:hypothetical protein